MKKLLITACLLIACQLATAQDFPLFDVGLKAGVNGSFVRNFTSELDSDGMRIGFVGGVWGRVKIPLIGLYVQPELVISQTGGKFSGLFDVGLGSPIQSDLTAKLTNFDAIVLVGQRFGLGPVALRLNVGPVFSNVLSAKLKAEALGESAEEDVKEDINSSQIGLQLGVGVDFSKFNIDLRFQQNFTKLFDDDDARISALQLTLAYKIL